LKSTNEYFVRKTLAAILSRWPEWRRYQQASPFPPEKGFWIIVPSPNKDVTRGLSISTDERRIIIGFDDDHDHLEQRKKEGLHQFRERVIARICDLLEDKIQSVSWRDEDDRLRTSYCFELPDAHHNQFVRSGFKCRIRSWSGKLDKDYVEP
jgi:hypothetical protein